MSPGATRYLLVTPAKNEGDNLAEVIRSVLSQTYKPALWIIIDDGSTDDTFRIAKEASCSHAWIYAHQLPPQPWDIGIHYSEVLKIGFDYIQKIASAREISYEFLGVLDADIILQRDYMEQLIRRFHEDQLLGIASGGIYYRRGNREYWEKSNLEWPRGAARLWRRECFEQTGGISISYAPDAVACVKAKLKGWKTRQFPELHAVQLRRTHAGAGLWRGYFTRGKGSYFLDYHPIHVILRAIKDSLRWPFYQGIAYVFGYIYAALKERKKIDDMQVKYYFRSQRLTEILSEILSPIKRALRPTGANKTGKES
jgi:glycosyltransferase involved in cell wall biosynthesis